jgi:hypothetical protein
MGKSKVVGWLVGLELVGWLVGGYKLLNDCMDGFFPVFISLCWHLLDE